MLFKSLSAAAIWIRYIEEKKFLLFSESNIAKNEHRKKNEQTLAALISIFVHADAFHWVEKKQTRRNEKKEMIKMQSQNDSVKYHQEKRESSRKNVIFQPRLCTTRVRNGEYVFRLFASWFVEARRNELLLVTSRRTEDHDSILEEIGQQCVAWTYEDENLLEWKVHKDVSTWRGSVPVRVLVRTRRTDRSQWCSWHADRTLHVQLYLCSGWCSEDEVEERVVYPLVKTLRGSLVASFDRTNPAVNVPSQDQRLLQIETWRIVNISVTELTRLLVWTWILPTG